jgi:molybdate transport system substrate-binding protein
MTMVFLMLSGGLFMGRNSLGLELCMPSAIKGPMDEIIAEFQALYRLRTEEVRAVYEPPIPHQARIETGEVGDVFVYACDDPALFQMMPSRIYEETQRELVLKALSIGLPEGNPQGIGGLEDLLKSSLLIGAVSLEKGDDQGVATAQMIQDLGLEERLRGRLRYVPSGNGLLPMLLNGDVGALFCWDITEAFNPGKLDIIRAFEGRYTKPVRIAVTRQSKQPDLALAFVEFAVSEPSRRHFQKYGFLLP